MVALNLKPKEERRLLRGHLWAYRNEFADLPVLEDGQIVDVVSDSGRFIGRGFYQAQGGIAVRLLSYEPVTIDADFFRRRIKAAKLFRERVCAYEITYRWIFGESDRLPGFIADRYGPVVSAQTACAFYQPWADCFAEAFLAHEGVEGLLFEICGEAKRYGETPQQVQFTVNGLKFALDLAAGQKTGMFLDQRDNCRAMQAYAAGARVLDGHCYAGMWSLSAAKAGAVSVLGVDTSANAIDCARTNAALNNLDSICSFDCADVNEVLASGVRYDLVLLDPPALAKDRAHCESALRLYQALNKNAIKALEPGGCLVTSCCSHFVPRQAFVEVLKRATRSLARQAWILDVRGAPADHPVLMAMPETDYLTCAILRVF